MNHSHTPGPWTTSKESPYTITRTDSFNFTDTIAHVNDRQCTGSGKANARLIAAAPDLLAALTECLPDLQHYVDTHGPGPDSRLAAARAAIAKATGEQTT